MPIPDPDRDDRGSKRYPGVDANESRGNLQRKNGRRYTSGVNTPGEIEFNRFAFRNSKSGLLWKY